MCMCEVNNVNGQPGYSWDGKNIGVRPPAPPTLLDGDEVLYDEPGRCCKTNKEQGIRGCDSHCHHFTLVRGAYAGYAILVTHGGGQERLQYGGFGLSLDNFARLDSDGRYWLMHMIHSIAHDQASEARKAESHRWRKAAAEKRIKVKKIRGQAAVNVTIE